MSYDEAKRVFTARMIVVEKIGHLQVYYNSIRAGDTEAVRKLRHNFWVFTRNERVARSLVGGCDWESRVFKVHIPPSVYRNGGKEVLTTFLDAVKEMGGETLAQREGAVWWGQFAPSTKTPTEEEKAKVEEITKPDPKPTRTIRRRKPSAFETFTLEVGED